ncbi:sulfonate ABC transporter substrate-binding protein [Burkholderia vietnamiensis]|uniref:Putative aliphatic sulfonates-binding protein n=1 Tax=Burkholderia vietnamiensis TaxID=60552 RepID=A0AAW7SWC6_BURVI|nr:ABC transporter substrate-binding protein [Burkholderia vietnamiensis]KKI36386.1 sulfonate ABC transporter substrate-binding protein [Burkholderia vietnamiensis]KVF12829.1 sulfonate ABC transporter substrate-binding protein [Burkholderia vietnamiensis]MBR8049983.1 ABC transporter substrate-binding protein [Burkholderia vietnamiensis]MDN7794104.1 ABC transporter substrate-binding protein [Burkholderia vietnamiensis]HDR8923297.1 ABC transporter substrate-binding protein [Burkholderia vietnami
MNPNRRHFLAQASALAATLSTAPAVLHAQSGTRPLLRAGDQKGGLRALLEAAGELNGVAYDIAWTEFPAAAPLAEALNAAAVDCGPIGDAPVIFALASGARLKVIGANRSDPYGTAVLVRPDAALKDAADLKGKRIGTTRGSIGHFVTLKALDAAGLPPDAVSFRFLPPADTMLALATGSIDAWATWEPYTALAETSGRARVLVNGRGLWSGLSYIAATDAAIAAKRDVLRDFVQRVVRAQAWSYRHVDAYSATLARIIGIPPAAAKLQFERRNTRWQPIDATVIAQQQRTADFYLKAGLLREPLDVRATFDRGFPLA